MVGENRRPHGQGVGDQRQVDRRIAARVRVAARRRAVADIDIAFGDIQLRLVRDVANGAGLRAAAEQRALRAFEDFDPLHVDHVDVIVAGRELHRLVVQVQGDVREGRRGRLRLVAGAAGTQAAHENIAAAGTVSAEGHVRRVPQQVIEGGDVELLQLLAGDRLNRDRYVLDALRASLGRDRDLLDGIGIGGLGRPCRHAQFPFPRPEPLKIAAMA